jgi:hypothetical protein
MKRLLFAFLVLVLAGSSFATSIDVQEKIPAETVWSFSVILPGAGDFSDADVFLNGNRIMSFYTYNDKIKFDEADIDKTKVFSSTEPIGNRVYFLVAPLSRGEHEIAVEVDGEEEARKEVDFFEIYDAGESADMETQLNSVRNTTNSLLNQVAELEAAALTEEDRQALQTSIDSIKSSVSLLEASLAEQGEDTSQKIDVLAGDVETLQDRTNDLNASMGTGMFSLFNLDPGVGMAIAFVVIAILVALALIRYKDRLPSLKGGLYGRQGDGAFTERDEEIAGQVMSESQDEAQKGKWAYGDFQAKKPEPERKRFNVGDLIKK